MSSPGPADPLLSEEIAELIASGVSMYVATRDAALMPESTLAMGTKIHPDGRRITVYLAVALSQATLSNVKDNGQIAITLSRPRDHKTVQIKGRVLQIRESGPSDREFQSVHRAALVEQYAGIGIPRATTRRLVWWPSVAVEVEVSSIFLQTPGPHAGEPMAWS